MTGADCDGCLVARQGERGIDLACNECGALVGKVNQAVLEALLGLAGPHVTCSHCGRVSSMPGFEKVEAFVCEHCGRAVG